MKRSLLLFIVAILAFLSCFSQIERDNNYNIDNYILDLIKLNYENIIKFDEPYEKKQIDYFKNKIHQILPNIMISEVLNCPFHIRKDCNSMEIGANVFFVNYSGEIKETGDGEVFPNKVTMTYRWKVLTKTTLLFIFANRELNSPLQEYIYIPCSK